MDLLRCKKSRLQKMQKIKASMKTKMHIDTKQKIVMENKKYLWHP